MFAFFLSLGLTAEVHLDSRKQKGAIKRTLFLDNHQSHRIFPLPIKRQQSLQCQHFVVYLRVSVPESPLWPLTFRFKFQPFFSNESSYLCTDIHVYFPFIGANFIIRPLAPFLSSKATDLMACGCLVPRLLSVLHTTLILILIQMASFLITSLPKSHKC